ncbi:MAG TPA: hypothetical protein VK694_02565 [Verrucomicrobiae bacterium]|nr:hypothetical protein [Verrucomicrobiae bacterium]
MVSEAGGKVTDFSRQTSEWRAPDFVTTNGTTLHDKIVELLG